MSIPCQRWITTALAKQQRIIYDSIIDEDSVHIDVFDITTILSATSLCFLAVEFLKMFG
jgi:hypothetical protein